MIELYHFGLSVCAHKVRMVLGEKGIEWTSHIVDLHSGEQFTSQYLSLNPNAVVPTLVHDKTVVTESTIICEYIDDAFPERPLRPTDSYLRASMRHWTKAVDEGLHAACGTLTIAAASGFRADKIRRSGQTIEEYVARIPDPARRERQYQALTQGLAAPGVQPALNLYRKIILRMEATLLENKYLSGPEFSLADASVAPYVLRLDMMGLLQLISDCPNVIRWYKCVREHRGFESVTRYISDDESETMRAYGTDVARILGSTSV